MEESRIDDEYNSILNSVKKCLGIDSSYFHFDPELIIFINTALGTLYQLGVTKKPKSISSHLNTWNEIVGEREDLEIIKSYVFLKVKVIFDPPASSAVLESYNKQISELEWRINVTVDDDDTFL